MRMKVKNNFYFLFVVLSLFFINFLSFSEEKPVTTIESLPVREKAEMNIEVTKISSEKMRGKINLEDKTIVIDLKEIKERLERNRRGASKEWYEISLTDDLNSFSKFSNFQNSSKYPYEIENQEGEERIKVNYSKKPETLYMGVIDKNSQSLVKVFTVSELQIENRNTTGIIGGQIDFKYSSQFNNIRVRDYSGEALVLINKAGTLKAWQYKPNEQFIRNAFPTIALGANWRKNEQNNNGKNSVTALTSNFSISENNSNKVAVGIYLENSKKIGAATGIYRHYISGLDTTLEKARVYGAYGVVVNNLEPTTEEIHADMVMVYPSTILTTIRNINQANFSLYSWEADQINYAVSTYNGNQFKVPHENNDMYNNKSNITPQKYPAIVVEKEIVMNNVVLEFQQGYEKNRYITFNSDIATTEESYVTKTVTGTNPNYFMIGTPFEGTISINGSGVTRDNIVVNISGITAEQDLNLSNGGKTANLKLKYETNGTVKMSLVNWSGQGNFPLTIVHKEKSGLTRRTYNVTIKTPQTFELIERKELNFGTIIKGFTGDQATTEIKVSGLTSSGLSLIPSQSSIKLTKDITSSEIEVGRFTVLKQGATDSNGVETYSITGTVLNSSGATVSGEHTGTLQLNVGLASRTKVSTPK